MNDRNEENLRELLEGFISSKEAENCIEDFAEVKRILDENPAPQPTEELVAAINYKIAEALRLRQEHTFRRLAYRLAPVAAVFIILASVSIRLYVSNSRPEKPGYVRLISSAVWDSENIAADDRNLVVLTTELDELEFEFATLESEENGGNGGSAITELEIDFAEINTDIWEG